MDRASVALRPQVSAPASPHLCGSVLKEMGRWHSVFPLTVPPHAGCIEMWPVCWARVSQSLLPGAASVSHIPGPLQVRGGLLRASLLVLPGVSVL